MSHAATLAELQAQLQALRAQLAALQAQTTQHAGATVASCPNLTRNLSRGSRGEDVRQLQQFLILQNLLASDSATGFFGALTERAVQQWQSKNGIVSSGSPVTTGYGAVGPRTRTQLSRCASTSPSVGQPVPSPATLPPILVPQRFTTPPVAVSPQPSLPITASNPVDTFSFDKTITFATQLTAANPSNLNHYPALWTQSNPGYFANGTGHSLVLTSLQVTLNAAPYDAATADVDICVDVVPLNDPSPHASHKTRNGIEVLCFTESKTSAMANWPTPTWTFDFPGQGLLVPPDYLVVCDAQAATAVPHSEGMTSDKLSDFSCSMSLKNADAASTKPAVQSLRSPYLDQYFNSTVSWFSAHRNTSSLPSRILGIYPYISAKITSADICFHYRAATDAGWTSNCETTSAPNLSTPTPHVTLRAFDRRYNQSDEVAAHCAISNEARTNHICAFFFFAAVPMQDGIFRPLPVNSTIPAEYADNFCNGPYRDYYLMSDPFYQADRTMCRDALEL